MRRLRTWCVSPSPLSCRLPVCVSFDRKTQWFWSSFCQALVWCAGCGDNACHLRHSAATIEFSSLSHYGAPFKRALISVRRLRWSCVSPSPLCGEIGVYLQSLCWGIFCHLVLWHMQLCTIFWRNMVNWNPLLHFWKWNNACKVNQYFCRYHVQKGASEFGSTISCFKMN